MNAERRIPIVLVVVSLALVLLVRTGSWAQGEPARLSDVTVTPHPDSVTVFVKTSQDAAERREGSCQAGSRRPVPAGRRASRARPEPQRRLRDPRRVRWSGDRHSHG